MKVCKFEVFDIEVEYEYRPNEDYYQALVPESFIIEQEVEDNFEQLLFVEQVDVLQAKVLETLEETIMFDTPDAPDFAISDVTFCFEKVE